MKTLLVIACFVLAGCTTHTPHPESVSDQTVLPSVIVCVFSACDTVLADRNADAAAGAALVTTEGIEADQRATATPTVEIPLAP